MTWSTRELADLAGTTINTVRHYHSLGLLEEPDRRYNGYKQYRVRHLVSLIRMRRLVELGVPLAQITELDAAAPEALRELDHELRAGIDRLTRVRADVAALARAKAPLDTPRGFEPLTAELSFADRSLIQICARLRDRDALARLAEMIDRESDATRRAFDALGDDTAEEAQDLLAAQIAASRTNWRAVTAAGALGRALADARRELYNPAQRRVIARASASTTPERPEHNEGNDHGPHHRR